MYDCWENTANTIKHLIITQAQDQPGCSFLSLLTCQAKPGG